MAYKLNYRNINQIASTALEAAEKTAFSILQDVEEAQTVPFLTGRMNQTADVKPYGNTGYQIIYSTPYAARQYYVPMNHTRTHHAHATDHWLDPYLTGGTRHHWLLEKYDQHLKKGMKKINGNNS